MQKAEQANKQIKNDEISFPVARFIYRAMSGDKVAQELIAVGETEGLEYQASFTSFLLRNWYKLAARGRV